MCGIIGIYHKKKNVASDIYDALIQVQHRGQDAAGISTWDSSRMYLYKELGLVTEVFKSNDSLNLDGNIGVGHVRYPTAGKDDVSEAQPFHTSNPVNVSLAHNGTLTNSKKIRDSLLKTRFCQFNTQSDSEVLLNLFTYELFNTNYRKLTTAHVFRALKNVFAQCEGGYAVTMLVAGIGIVSFRDAHGIRPLVIGKNKDSYMVASESGALTALGYSFERDVAPGEAVIISEDGTLVTKQIVRGVDHCPCLFEFVYFSRPDSTIDSISVHKSRLRMGDFLGENILENYPNLKADVVVPIPDTSRTSAMQVAYKLKAKYREGFIKNRYIGRTFIMPGQTIRKKSVSHKLSPIKIEFRGKNVLLVDDSIVRGNTSKKIIEMVKKCGAKKVYLASASPPIRHQNVYGIDMPAVKDLIAHGKTIDQIKKYIKADELIYQSLDDLKRAAKIGNPMINKFEDSVFTGEYCTGTVSEKFLEELENSRLDSTR